MTVRAVATGFVLDCDVCPESLEDGDLAIVLPTPDQITRAGTDAGWTALADGRHVCTRENTAHTQETP